MITKICKSCGKAFGLNYPDGRVKYCKRCASTDKYVKAKHPIIACPVCKKTFSKINSFHKFCSSKCKDRFHTENYQNRMNSSKEICGCCGKGFMTFKSNKKYCSHKCYENAKTQRDRLRRLAEHGKDKERAPDLSYTGKDIYGKGLYVSED